MSIVWSEQIDNMLKAGISLESIGVKNWALSKDEAVNVLRQFLIWEVPVLGGDVCELIDGRMRHNYDSWHCNRLANESEMEFASRSIKKAIEYVTNYNTEDMSKVFFAFVPDL